MMFRVFFLLALVAACLSTSFAAGRPHLATNYARAAQAQANRVAGNGTDPFAPPAYYWKTFNFTQIVDHFNSSETRTFDQRVLINDTWWTKPDANGENGGPIFFYTGNEGSIELFATNTGFMWDIAPQFGALLIFVEHRYYGHTKPFGVHSFDSHAERQYLTVEQALADYAYFLRTWKAQNNALNSPVIAFGGSYGGMLTAYFRLWYPDVVAGGISASAPLLMFTGGVTDVAQVYNHIATRTFARASQRCANWIGNIWTVLTNLAATQNGLALINKSFKLCPPMNNTVDVTNNVFPWIANALSTLPMGDYPYPSSFLGDLPGNPVNYVCSFFNNDNPTDAELLTSMEQLLNTYYNYTGAVNATCNNLNNESGISTLAGDGTAWSYQSCNQMILPVGQYGGHSDFFYPQPWDLAADRTTCQSNFPGVAFNSTWGLYQWLFADLSNVVFSNGDLDPWSGGGIGLLTVDDDVRVYNLSDNVVSVYIHGGAHHLDLRSNNTLDPQSVIAARALHVSMIKQFMANPNPNAPDCSRSGLSKKQVAAISVVTTIVACGLAVAAYVYCIRKPEQNINGDYHAQP